MVTEWVASRTVYVTTCIKSICKVKLSEQVGHDSMWSFRYVTNFWANYAVVIKQNKKCTHNVISRRIRATFVAVESQQLLYILTMCSLSYPACKTHAPYHLTICGLAKCTVQYFPHHLINSTTFGKTLLNIKCVFWFSLHISPEIFLILIRLLRDIINVQTSSRTVPIILVRF
jgi:hypothetical protein